MLNLNPPAATEKLDLPTVSCMARDVTLLETLKIVTQIANLKYRVEGGVVMVVPWNAPDDVGKISPVEASQRYLEHLVAAWENAFPDAPAADQQVVLTVPASFDPVARELTREAALAAGLPRDFVLLEEPQAALYAWLATTGDRWRTLLKVDETVLVCDIGGGTTDLTLVRVTEEEGTLALERVAVGNHLLVGGDNMDLTLAHVVAAEFAKQNVKLDAWQSVSLWHSCRAAKESLLSTDGPEKQSISVLGRGSKLIGGTVSVEVERQTVSDLLVDGFLPKCEAADRPQKQRASGCSPTWSRLTSIRIRTTSSR